MTRVTTNSISYTPESVREADILKAYCESCFPVGDPSFSYKSAESYRELHSVTKDRYSSAVIAREAARAHFNEYAKGKSGTLYWRVPPEIVYNSRKCGFVYYMRLLISNKPKVA